MNKSMTSTVYSARRQPLTGRGTSATSRAAAPSQPRVMTAFDSLGRPENLPDEIAQQLRARILNESLAPGQRLPTEQELGAQFGVSRNVVREAIARRFAAMLAQGALDEVRALLALDLDPALPAMRAVGVAELAAHLAGEIPLAEAERRAVLASGQYGKRQTTWFRHHGLAEPSRTHTIYARVAGLEQFSESEAAFIISFIHGSG